MNASVHVFIYILQIKGFSSLLLKEVMYSTVQYKSLFLLDKRGFKILYFVLYVSVEILVYISKHVFCYYL